MNQQLPLYLRIAQLLRQHVGREQLVSSREIARKLGLRGRDARRKVRAIISSCRCDGTFEEIELHLVAIPGCGYFVPADLEECQAYDGVLAKLEAAAIELRKAFRRQCHGRGLNLNIPTHQP